MAINFTINRSIRNLFYITIICFGLGISSCNNDFLEETRTPEIYPTADTIFITSETESFTLDLDMRTSSRSWRLFQFPQWLDITPKEGVLENNSTVNFNFEIDHNRASREYGFYSFPLVFDMEDMGLQHKTIVYFDLGEPGIDVFPQSLNLETYMKGEISISNNRNGLLIWEVIHKPSWLKLEAIADMYPPYTIYQYKYEAITSGLASGEYNDNIVIKNNAGSDVIIPVSLKISNLGYNGVYYTGELLASEYMKNQDKLVVLTKNPNRMYFFDATEVTPDVVELYNTPRSFALSENETMLAIGFENDEISTYNSSNGDLIKTYKTNMLPIQVQFAQEDYICFNGKSYYFEYMHSLNLSTGKIIQATDDESGYRVLSKIPNKNILIATKTGWSPDYLTFFFMDTPGDLNKVNEYPMAVNGFWLSDDGNRVFTGTQRVYELPTYDPDLPYVMDNHPPLISIFELNNQYDIRSMAHQSATERLFIAFSDGPYSPKTYIYQVHHTTFAEQKSYSFSSLPPVDFPEGKSWYEMTKDIYPTNDGSKLWLVQEYRAAEDYAHDTWSVRVLKLDDLN